MAWKGCGKRVQTVYYPLPAFGVAQYWGGQVESVGEDWGLRLPSGEVWKPGWTDALAGRRVFACKDCWQVRWLPLATGVGWNEVVTYLSGGLLYGKEVRRPGWLGFGERRMREPGVPSAERGVWVRAEEWEARRRGAKTQA